MGVFDSSCPIPAEAEDYGDHGSSWKPMLYAAGACTGVTIAIAVSLILLHLRRYRSPKEQRQIIRITFSVVVYSIVAFFEIYDYRIAQYIDPIGDIYEAFGLCALFLLFIQYAAPSGTFDEGLFSTVKAAEETETKFDWPRITWIFVFQYPVFEILAIAIEEATEATGHFCANSLEPQFAHLWVEVISSVSITFCVLSILRFRNNTKQLMKQKRGLAKILCFKGIVFIRFTQAWVFSALLQYKAVKTSDTFSYNDILWGIPGLATCGEMVLFALGFWYAFSSTEYGSSAKPRDRPLPLWKAVLDALNPWDLIAGTARVFPLCFAVHRSGDWKRWRAEAKNASLVGKAVKKYKNKKRQDDGQYQALNVSMEPVTYPADPQRMRSESDAAQGDTGYYSTPGLDARHMYQPPAGMPADEARTHLMAEPGPGGYWNGQHYDRSSSPRPAYDGVPAARDREMV